MRTRRRVRLPGWPALALGVRRFSPRAELSCSAEGLSSREYIDRLALAEAGRLADELASVRCSGTTGTWTELMWSNSADFTALASSASEGSLISGLNDQPVLSALFFHNKVGRYRSISLLARGVFSNTGTPTLTFQARLGTTAGSSYLSGTSVGVSAAITTGSGVTNKWWELRLDLTCYTPGIGTGNTTLSGSGYVMSPGGFAAPYVYALEPTTPDTATWTSTIDNALTQYLNLSATWSASDALNTIKCKQLYVYGWN
jgi:hypothetical protein